MAGLGNGSGSHSVVARFVDENESAGYTVFPVSIKCDRPLGTQLHAGDFVHAHRQRMFFQPERIDIHPVSQGRDLCTHRSSTVLDQIRPRRIERLGIEAALELTGDNRASAAEMLGLSRQSLYVKLRRYGLGDLASEDEK